MGLHGIFDIIRGNRLISKLGLHGEITSMYAADSERLVQDNPFLENLI